MEGLELSFVTIRRKLIVDKSAVRLIATLKNENATANDMKHFQDWLECFYKHVSDNNMHFCLVYVLDCGADNLETFKAIVPLISAHRDITRRLSITTVVVAPPALSLLAQVVMHLYKTEGSIQFLETLRDAKLACRNAVAC